MAIRLAKQKGYAGICGKVRERKGSLLVGWFSVSNLNLNNSIDRYIGSSVIFWGTGESITYCIEKDSTYKRKD